MTIPESAALKLAINIFYYIGQCSILLPLYLGFRYWPSLSAGLRAMVCCCLMWTAMTILGEACGKLLGYNLAVWQTVDILDVWFIGAIYYHILRFRLRRYFLLIGALYTAFALVDMFVINDLWNGIQNKLVTVNNYTLVVKHLLLISLILLYFEQSLRYLRNVLLERDPVFIVSVALLIFHAGTFVLFLVRTSLTIYWEYFITIPLLTALNLLLYLLLAWAFRLAGRAPQVVPEAAPVHSVHS